MGDLISRQALCEYALNQKDKSVSPNDIMRFPSAQPEQQWIPVTERLPEESGDYLVTRYAGYAPDLIIIDIARYEPGEWHKAYPVTAWMPLPEPYQGGEKK